jgi:hypothetical protein
MKKIKFTPMSQISNNSIESPGPSSRYLPEWYKKMPNFVDGQTSFAIGNPGNNATNTTLKHCSPFLDALTSGYIWSLPADIQVAKREEGFFFNWMVDGVLVTDHTAAQHPGLPAPHNGEPFVMKWSFDYRITTPKGYSTFFMHPANRNDLPFRTFSGIVDTDKFNLTVQFPFQLIPDPLRDTFIIPKNTPVVQMMPFKRESWKMEREKFCEGEYEKNMISFRSTITKSYKKMFWSKKKYT